jgi:DNA-binding MarR family transcriptional regulator
MTDDELLDQVGPALSRMRRRTASSGGASVLRNVVLNVVADAGRVTVTGLAAQMGVAQPVASRVVAGCVTEGLLHRVASQEDGRSVLLELTDAGLAEQTRLAREQRRVFEQITAHWAPSDRIQFADYLVTYAADSARWSAARSEES